MVTDFNGREDTTLNIKHYEKKNIYIIISVRKVDLLLGVTEFYIKEVVLPI